MLAGALDRRVQFHRFGVPTPAETLWEDAAVWTDAATFDTLYQFNGLATPEEWNTYGFPIWASRKDVSDGERYRGGEVNAQLTARFQVRWSQFTATITPKDRIECEGRMYDIVGIKEVGRREGREITASVRIDL